VRKFLGFGAVFLAVGTVSAIPGQASAVDDPWSVGVAAGYFMPATEGWEDNYGQRGGWVPNLAVGYAASTWLSVAAETAYFSASNFARGAITLEPSIERQRLTLVPTTVGLEARLRLAPTQFVVPFLGGGYRRVSYRLKVGSNETASGGANGWVGRAGFDVLLNPLDPSAASGLREDYGVARSYVRFEAQWAKAEAPKAPGASGTSGADIDLGGATFLAGLRFEF
jgi:hypothetical protein